MVLRGAVPRLCVAEPRWVYHFNPSLGGGPIHRLSRRGRNGPYGVPGHSLVGLQVADVTDAFRIESHRVPVHEVGSLKQCKKILHLPSKPYRTDTTTSPSISSIKSIQPCTIPLYKESDYRLMDRVPSQPSSSPGSCTFR